MISVNPEKRVKTDFETVFFEGENEDQKCIFALCENPTLSKKGEPWRDLYIAFRGTDVNDYEDILTGQFWVHTYLDSFLVYVLILLNQSYEIKSSPWTILWFRILGIFSVKNIARLGVFMFQTSDNSQLCIDSQYSSQ